MDLHTMTHARIRLSQGDVAGARGVLSEILRRDPDHQEARRLLATLATRASGTATAEPDEWLAPPQAGDAAELRARFREQIGRGAAGAASRRRIGRLRRWLDRLGRAAASTD